MPGKVTCAAFCSLALLMRLNWLSEEGNPFPLKTRVWARLGVSTIIPGVLPAEIGVAGPRTSFCASTINTPAAIVPALTLFERKARYLIALVDVLPGELAPQLSNVRLAASRNNRRIRALFKPGTPTSCRIIAWMQE